MTNTEKTYGGALYDLAKEEARDRQVLEEMTALDAAFAAEPDFLRLLSVPSLPKAERCGILQESFGGKIDPYLLNFLKILCENGTISQFHGCMRAYKARYDADNGILEARAVTAVPMPDALREKLREKLGRVTGKTVELDCRVDPACMGGVRLEMQGEELDGTVKNRLDTLRRQLAQATL